MELSEFAQLLQNSPELFRNLLEHRNCADSTELRRKIIAFYTNLAPADIVGYRQHHSLPNQRIMRIATLIGLESKLAFLPIQLVEDYTQTKEQNEGDRPPITDEEIVFWLTGGTFPIDFCFLVTGQFCIWDPARRDLLIISLSDGDPLLHQASAKYLQSAGSVFSTLQEAREEAVRRETKRLRDSD